jgi:hypothetical protein
MRIIPRSAAIDDAEEALANAFVTMVGGTRPFLSPAQVADYLRRFYSVEEQSAQIKRYRGGDFLILFANCATADHVLPQQPPEVAGVKLIFWRWHRQARALFAPLRYKVLLSITKIYAHVWSEEIAQEILGSSYKMFESSPSSIDGSDLSSYLMVAWT